MTSEKTTAEEIFRRQRSFFLSGATRSIDFRKKALRGLLDAVTARRDELLEALKSDLGKAPMEGYLAEVGLVKEEIRYTLRHLKRWMKPERVITPMVHFPAVSRRYKDPLGVALIMAPWNYPFQLCAAPLAAAVSAETAPCVASTSGSTPSCSTLTSSAPTPCS